MNFKKLVFGAVVFVGVSLTASCASAQGVPHSNTLGWTASTTGGVTSQKVYRGTSAAGPFTLIATIPNGTTVTFQDNDTTQGVTHYYVLTALIGTNESVFSTKVNATDVGTNVNPQTGVTVTSN